jgi:hypothetical protein
VPQGAGSFMNELVIPIEKAVVTASQPKKTVKKKGKPRGESKTSVRRLAILAKQMQALEYRKMGFTYQMIADELGYQTAQGASAAIMTAIELTMKEPAGAVLALELERLDALMAKPYQAALNGDLVALNSVLAIMNRRARYLGLDAPAKTAATAVIETIGNRPFIEATVSLPEYEAVLKRVLAAY